MNCALESAALSPRRARRFALTSIATLATIVALAAPAALAVVTTASQITYQGQTPGSPVIPGIPIPPPTAITVFSGDNVVLQAWLSNVATNAQPAPTGTITFRDGAQVLGSFPLSVAGVPCSFICTFWQATLSTTTLAVGVHTISATYDGDATYAPSSANTVAVTVSPVVPPPTSVTTTTSVVTYQGQTPGGPVIGIPIPPPAVLQVQPGDVVVVQGWIAYTDSAGLPDPGGAFEFRDNGVLVATRPPTYGEYPCAFICQAWQATLTTTLTPGNHLFTVSYGGDGRFQPSTGNRVLVIVGAPAPVPAHGPVALIVLCGLAALGGLVTLRARTPPRG